MRVRPIFRCSILALIFSVVIGIFASHAPTAKAVWISPSGEICIPNIEIYDIYINGEYQYSEQQQEGFESCTPAFDSTLYTEYDQSWFTGVGGAFPQCSVIRASLPANCDLNNPAPMVPPDGCSSPAPDGLGPVFSAGYQTIFKAACDAHDICYGTLGSSKYSCDAALEINMITDA